MSKLTTYCGKRGQTKRILSLQTKGYSLRFTDLCFLSSFFAAFSALFSFFFFFFPSLDDDDDDDDAKDTEITDSERGRLCRCAEEREAEAGAVTEADAAVGVVSAAGTVGSGVLAESDTARTRWAAVRAEIILAIRPELGTWGRAAQAKTLRASAARCLLAAKRSSDQPTSVSGKARSSPRSALQRRRGVRGAAAATALLLLLLGFGRTARGSGRAGGSGAAAATSSLLLLLSLASAPSRRTEHSFGLSFHMQLEQQTGSDLTKTTQREKGRDLPDEQRPHGWRRTEPRASTTIAGILYEPSFQVTWGPECHSGAALAKARKVSADDMCSSDIRTRSGAICRGSLVTDNLDNAADQGHVDRRSNTVLAKQTEDTCAKFGRRERKIFSHDSGFEFCKN